MESDTGGNTAKPKHFWFKDVYENHYKKLLVITFVILFIAIFLIGYKVVKTGDFINRDVSLKGGVTITIPTTKQIDISQLQDTLSAQFPKNDLTINSISQFGSQVGIILKADIKEEQANSLIQGIGKALNLELTTKDYSIEIVGSSLGTSFFKETFTALIIAFICMAIVVFLSFRIFIPSAAVVLCGFSDIIITLAIVNLIGIKLSTAGIAAFLMLIGYSVDTDILLTTRVLKRKEGTEMERIYGAFKTGIMMSTTTIVAVSIGLIFTQSAVIRQIMIIILVGMFVDIVYTWVQNVGILRLYLERKAKKAKE
jgi:preprotein translocase subunit SecF